MSAGSVSPATGGKSAVGEKQRFLFTSGCDIAENVHPHLGSVNEGLVARRRFIQDSRRNQSGIMTHYAERLAAAVAKKRNPVTVGLDPRDRQLPQEVLARACQRHASSAEQIAGAFEEFCSRIIDVVAPLVPAVKPQAAFFEEWGPAGCQALARVIAKARQSGLIVICDAKRGDIGTTAEAYARGYLAGADPAAAAWGADALTVSPYLGRDTLEPFVKVATERGAGIYVLVRTSNPGAGTFQDIRHSDGMTVYQLVAAVIEEFADATRGGKAYGAVGAVVGATYPQELAELRQAMPHAPFLIPGYGAQGGGAKEVATAFATDGSGAIVNSSRGIIFARERKEYAARFAPAEWERAVEAATREMIADLAMNTPAGKLQGLQP
jgi:orotidine-5'-phosphate decarboxylase